MAGNKKLTSRDKPDKSGIKARAKDGTSKDVKSGKKMTQNTNQQKPSTTTALPRFAFFMNLPAELRQMVYEFTLTENRQSVFVDRWNANHCVFRPPRTVFPELCKGSLATCQQVRGENRPEVLQPQRLPVYSAGQRAR
ncbi:MAG: hypothetical protein Q9161_009107 [Pseudevernia consocians]